MNREPDAAGHDTHSHAGETPAWSVTLCPTCMMELPPDHPLLGESVVFSGRVVEIGTLDHGVGITLRIEGAADREITVTGMTFDEVRHLRNAFGETVRISIGAAK